MGNSPGTVFGFLIDWMGCKTNERTTDRRFDNNGHGHCVYDCNRVRVRVVGPAAAEVGTLKICMDLYLRCLLNCFSRPEEMYFI